MIRGESFTIAMVFNAEYDIETRIQDVTLSVGNITLCQLSDDTIIKSTANTLMCYISSQNTSYLQVGERAITMALTDSVNGVRKAIVAVVPVQNSGNIFENEVNNESANLVLSVTYDITNIVSDLIIADIYMGAGLPHGGVEGQHIRKVSSTNYDVEWSNQLDDITTQSFDPNVAGDAPAYTRKWDATEGTFVFGLPDGGQIQEGKELFDYYVNADTVPLVNGDIVSIVPIAGNRKAIARTNVTNQQSAHNVIGMVTVPTIAVGATGRVTKFGEVHDLLTSLYPDGTELFVSESNPGKWATVGATPPNYTVKIGTVIVSQNGNGIVELGIQCFPKLGDLSDVNGVSSSVNKPIVRKADGVIDAINTGLDINGITPSSGTTTITGDLSVDDITSDVVGANTVNATNVNTTNIESTNGFVKTGSSDNQVLLGAGGAKNVADFQLKSEKGQANGYASLDSNGLVPSTQLPSYVDDVIEVANYAALPAVGETGKIYVTLDTNKAYRWSGSTYVYITSGAVDSVAGKTGVVTLVKADVGLANVDNTSDANKPISTATQTALNGKVNTTDIEQTRSQSTTKVPSSKLVDDELKYTQKQISVNTQSIASIENVINSANINQELTATATGVDTIALPKTAANTGMQVQMFGQSAEQLVANGNFANGTTGWVVDGAAAVDVSTGRLVYTAVYTPHVLSKSLNFVAGNKYYFYIETEQSAVGSSTPTIMAGYYPGINSDTALNLPNVIGLRKTSGIYTPSAAFTYFRVYTYVPAGQTVAFDNIRIINLTATFGAGNEPTKEQCDILFANYFEGSDNVLGVGRVMSVGKNLFPNKWIITSGAGVDILSTGISITAYNSNSENNLQTFPIRIERGKPHTLSMISTSIPSGGVVHFSAYIDQSDDGVTFENLLQTYYFRSSGLNYLTFTPTKSYIRYRQSGAISHGGTQLNIQLEKGATATAYEPYRQSILQLTTPELRSNGLVKDEIRKGTNGYELVKRVGVGTLGSEMVVNGTFDTDTGWEKQTGWTISGGKAIGINTETTALVQNVSVVPGKWHRLMADIIVNSGYGLQPQIASFVITNNWATSGKKITYFKPSFSGYLILYGLGNFNIEVDNVSLKELTTADIIADASLFTEIGSNVHFTLATTTITPIAHAGLLNSNSTGTAYFEPIIADAGVYSSNSAIQLTDYPIASFESIRKYANGTYTELDITTAVIAGNGLSFTHPNLTAGDLVMFTYAYNKESIGRSMTLTHYDSRFVIADTANGKVYRWKITSTNGVATIALTEV